MLQMQRRSRERGFTLTEILVAIAIFAVIFIAALTMYDRSNRAFKEGVERADMQQNVRVGFDKLVADLRLAGFDFDRDGFPTGSGTGTVWQRTKAYGLGNVVSPITANGFTYVCIQAGTSGANQPTWSTVLNGTTLDGTVLWRTQPGMNQYQQTDEQIEYAHQRAITIRGNFDFETKSEERNGREEPLESAQFPVVTTGNDEIVTYALRSVRGPNPDSVEFYADIPDRRTYPGGRAENLVRIPNVDLCATGCNNPPYTLYRFTLNDAGAIVESPVASNIRSIEFSYYPDTIGTATPLTFTAPVSNVAGTAGGGQYNPNNPNLSAEARARRAAIKSIRVALIGMTPTRDRFYTNPDEDATSPAVNYRTYRLESLIVPRNLGKMGAREQQEAPPGEPALQSVCAGWCGGVRVTWAAPTATGDTGDVDQYVIIYDTATPPVRYQKQVGPVTTATVEGLDPTQRWFFTIAAVNSFGTTMAMTGPAASPVPEVLPTGLTGLDVRNMTTPEPPNNLTVSGNGGTGMPPEEQNQITLNWTNPVDTMTGANSVTCVRIDGTTSVESDVDVQGGELLRYEILRGRTANFNPANASEYTVVGVSAPNVFSGGLVTSSFVDKTAVACETYYYRIRYLERCHPATATTNVTPGVPESTYVPPFGTAAMLGRASASAPPSAPMTLILSPTQSSSCGVNCNVYLTWPKVTTDTSPLQKQIAVEDYVVTRRQMKGGTLVATETFDVADTTPGVGQWVTTGPTHVEYWQDPSPPPTVDPNDGVSYQYIYTVRARFSCPTVLDSAESSEVRYPCTFAGSNLTVDAAPVQSGDGSSPANAWETTSGVQATIRANGTNIESIQVLLASLSSSSVINLGTQSGTGPWNFPVSGTSPGEIYRVYVIARDANGCLAVAMRYLEEGTPSGCCLAAQANDPLVVQYSPNSSFIDVFLKNQCANDLMVQPNGINITWSTASPTPTGTVLRSIEYPHRTAGRVTQTVNNATGTFSVSLPADARNPIPAGATYRIQLQFNTILPNANAPLTNFCVTYVRDGVELSGQNCRIVPAPPAANPDLCN